MSPEKMIFYAVIAIGIVSVLILLYRYVPRRVKVAYYVHKWREIQKLCANKDDWMHALVHADMLLDEVLRKKKITGKTMGERMVNAQPDFSANDAIWSAHKLVNAIRQESAKKVSENEVKNALIAYRQALRDLGALS
jgi:hypothetical protein